MPPGPAEQQESSSNADLDHKLGYPLPPQWQPPLWPPHETISGRNMLLQPLDLNRHGEQLYAAVGQHDTLWTYLQFGPFSSQTEFIEWLGGMLKQRNRQYYAVMVPTTSADPTAPASAPSSEHTAASPTRTAVGMCCYLNVQPADASIELGGLCFGPALRNTAAGSEALIAMVQNAFALGYRRMEWKCNALNQASRRAAQRLGLGFEGIFKAAAVVKGRHRNVAYYAVTASQWPQLADAYQQWLSTANFTADGQQVQRLSLLTQEIYRTGSTVIENGW